MFKTLLVRSLQPARASTSAAAATPPPLLLQRWLSANADQKQPVVLREADLEESFVKGSGACAPRPYVHIHHHFAQLSKTKCVWWGTGKGGQKINKVRNCVLLKHTPTGLLVRCQKTRSLDDNRRVARKLLVQKLDDHFNGQLSARSLKFARLRKRKASKKAKSRQKYATAHEAASERDDDEESDDDDEWEDHDDDDEEEEEDDDSHPHAFKAKWRE